MKALYQPIPQEHFIPVFITLAIYFIGGFILLGACLKVAKGFERFIDRKPKR